MTRDAMARNLLIGLAAIVAIAALATGAIVGRDWLHTALGGTPETPSIMIVSRQTLVAGIAAGQQQQARVNEALTFLADKKNADKANKDDDASKAGTGLRNGNALQAEKLEFVLDAMEDPLGGTLGQEVQQSGRFRLIAQATVVDAMATYQKKNNIEPAQIMPNLIKNHLRTPSGSSDSTTAAQTRSDSRGIVGVANTLHAQYVLMISMGEPHFTVDKVDGDQFSPDRIVFTAQPVINCEVFDPKTGISYRFNEQLAKPVVVGVPIAREVALAGQIGIAFNQFNQRLSKDASQQVLSWLLENFAPARIVRTGSQIVINRGANDGVAAGAVYNIVRETGDAIREGGDEGTNLGRIRVPVGSILIRDVQDRISTASIASGGPMLKDDIVQIVQPTAASANTPAAASDDTPLGSRALDQAQAAKSGAAVHQANVAVDDVSVNGHEAPELAKLLADSLARDPRITILSRADLQKVLHERQINQAATGDYSTYVAQGLRTSGYLVAGEFHTSSSSHANTVSVGGVTRVVSVSTSGAASGVLRATATDGRQVESVSVPNAPSVGAAAQMAARDLLLKLFPMEVVQVNGATVAINRGQDAGLRPGMRLQLYRRGTPIIDKQTGAVLSAGMRTSIGQAVIVDVEQNVGTASIVGGAAVSPGDVAEIMAGGSALTAPRAAPARAAGRRKSQASTEPSGLHF